MEHIVSEFFSQYAYTPWLVYGAICLFMMLSAFGMPIPEEIILVSSGFVGYMALNPADYPPPYPGAISVNVYVLAGVAFAAVVDGGGWGGWKRARDGRNRERQKQISHRSPWTGEAGEPASSYGGCELRSDRVEKL